MSQPIAHPSLQQQPRLRPERILFGLVLALTGLLCNFRSLIVWRLHPDVATIEMLLWFLAAVFAFVLLRREGQLAEFLGYWSDQRLLIAFLAFIFLSVAWSANPALSALRALALLAASWTFACLGYRLSGKALLRYLALLAVAMLLATLYFVIAEAPLGKSSFYKGAWRGVFWHKNHLGPLAALAGAILLLQALELLRVRRWMALTACVAAYALALVVAWQSRSAAGIFLIPILHGLMLAGLLWQHHAGRLMPAQRRILWMLAGVAIIVILANLGPVFALLGKDLTMTGRTRLWWYVLDEFVARQPLLGHGFNALWGDHAFQQAAAARLNFIPVIGDNGFLDVLLNLGLVGLALFLALYFLAWRRAFRLLAAVRTPAAVAPLVVMGFSFFGNLSYSFLLEIELFVWGMMVAIIFARPSPGAPAQ